jgi:hypothetical protein
MAKLEIPKQTSYPSELAFQVDIENFLRNEKFRVFSIRDSRRVTMPGWPDIFAWRGNKIIAVELKMPKNKLTADQITVLAELKTAGVETFVLYPSEVELFKSQIKRGEPHGDQTEDEDFNYVWVDWYGYLGIARPVE